MYEITFGYTILASTKKMNYFDDFLFLGDFFIEIFRYDKIISVRAEIDRWK